MRAKTIDVIRDLAVSYQDKDLDIAIELMNIAVVERPEGRFINKMLSKWKDLKLDNFSMTADAERFNQLVAIGQIAVIPIGFRCYTTQKLKKEMGLNQASLPFDSGFFPPSSVLSIFVNPKVEMDYSDPNSHAVCVKIEKSNSKTYGLGITFESSSYDEINSIVTNRTIPKMNKYLDSTFGYYTLDKNHNFVLAHYNWHEFADIDQSNRVCEPSQNIQLINNMLNKRIERMLGLCDTCEHIFFVTHESQSYNHMKIDEKYHSLNNYSELKKHFNIKYKNKFSIVDLGSEIGCGQLVNMAKNMNLFN
jgi:hypothetical protein